MKVLALKNQKPSKVLNLKLLKNKVYKIKNINNYNETHLRLKKKFKIIFKFYILNKKMLLLGVNKKYNNFIFNLIKNTKNSYIPDTMWFQGILTNSNIIFKYLVLSKNISKLVRFLFNLKTKINLILVLNDQQKKFNEIFNLKIPILGFINSNKYYDYKTNLLNINIYFFLKVLKKRLNIFKNNFNKSANIKKMY